MSGKKWIVVLIVAVAAWFAFSGKSGMGAAAKDLRIDTVKRGRMNEILKLRGKVELDKKEAVSSQIAGLITKINVAEGSVVVKDAVVMELDTKDIETSLKKARAYYNSAYSTLMDLKTGVREEQKKQAGEQVAQARIALDAARKDYEYKKDRLGRIDELIKTGSAASQERRDIKIQCDMASSALMDAEKRVKVAEYALDLLEKGATEHALKAAEFNAEQAKMAVVDLENVLGKAKVRAGIDGVVLSKNFEPNGYAQAGNVLFEVGDYSSAYIRVDVLVDDMAKVKIGQKALISGDVVGGEKFDGEVYYIAPKAFTKVSSLGVEQQKIEVRIRYDVNRLKLRPGYELDSDIITHEKSDALHVAYKAVFEVNGESHVFRIKNGVAELCGVKAGIENDDYIEILNGLSGGEKVVIDPPSTLKPGMRIIQ